MTTREYFERRAVEGRATIVYYRSPDDLGNAQPHLWLCQVGGHLVACDANEFLVAADTMTVEAVAKRWRLYLRRRRDDWRAARLDMRRQAIGLDVVERNKTC